LPLLSSNKTAKKDQQELLIHSGEGKRLDFVYFIPGKKISPEFRAFEALRSFNVFLFDAAKLRQKLQTKKNNG
jgi:hypothetical protein